jgi:carboxylesterase
MSLEAGPFSLGPVGGEGPAVLCLHGLTGTPYEVRPPAEALAAGGFACLGPLLPGHGTSTEDLARTPREAWIEAARDALDALGETHARVYVLGLSLGGLIALRLAAEQEVAGLLVMAAPLDLGRLVRWGVPRLAGWIQSIPKHAAIRDPEARRRHPSYRRMPLRAVAELLELQEEVRAGLGRVTAPIRGGDPRLRGLCRSGAVAAGALLARPASGCRAGGGGRPVGRLPDGPGAEGPLTPP